MIRSLDALKVPDLVNNALINPFDIIAIVNQRGLIKVIHHSAVKPVLHSYRP
ncbi:hypothetical protein [Aeromonas salmonicida]|uniref:hypothetical protein n=1 Tax=Aeromonas salmonicida TaxID=645 RepID=UPI0018FEE420|nr:hypothetical protein [Aeromonas salmonicida]